MTADDHMANLRDLAAYPYFRDTATDQETLRWAVAEIERLRADSKPDIFSRVCRELPEGWSVEIMIDPGVCEIILHDPYFAATIFDHGKPTLTEGLEAALAYCLEHKEGLPDECD